MPINYKHYPPDWFTRIVPAVARRSHNKCEECGLSNGQKVWSVQIRRKKGKKTVYRKLWLTIEPNLLYHEAKKVKVVLTVAHIDNDAHNHKVSIDRLLHLCQRCHLKADAYYKAIKRKCGYYCDSPLCTNLHCIHKTPSPCQPNTTAAISSAPNA